MHVHRSTRAEIVAAFQERARKMERRINFGRIAVMTLFAGMDFFVGYKTGSIRDSQAWIMITGVGIFIGVFVFVHAMTSGGKYRAWVPFFASTYDFLIVFAIARDYLRLDILPMDEESLVYFFILVCLVLVFLNVLRHGKAVVLYNTALALGCALMLVIGKIADSFVTPMYIATIIVLAGFLTLTVATSIEHLFVTVQNRENLKRFLPLEVVDGIDSGEINLELGGTNRDVTLLLADIRSFTTISEKHQPQEVVGLLNRYFTEMCRVIFDYGGSIDKFIGDAVLAVFGLTDALDDPEERALNAALKMQHQLVQVNADLAPMGFAPISIGIALHSGSVVASNIGSQERMEYTVIGDTVNTVSRIEALNKAYRTHILLSESVAERLDGEARPETGQQRFRYVTETVLRGREATTKLYTPT